MMKSHLMIGFVVIVLLATVTNFAQGKHLLSYGSVNCKRLSNASIMYFLLLWYWLFLSFLSGKIYFVGKNEQYYTGDGKLILL